MKITLDELLKSIEPNNPSTLTSKEYFHRKMVYEEHAANQLPRLVAAMSEMKRAADIFNNLGSGIV